MRVVPFLQPMFFVSGCRFGLKRELAFSRGYMDKTWNSLGNQMVIKQLSNEFQQMVIPLKLKKKFEMNNCNLYD
jgi:hypothetical protein